MSGGEWLREPDNEKTWLVMREGSMRLVTVCLARRLCWPVTSSGSPNGWPIGEITQWHRTPDEPPPPLPKSRMVEMTALVRMMQPGSWHAMVHVGHYQLQGVHRETETEARQWCHAFGVDPVSE